MKFFRPTVCAVCALCSIFLFNICAFAESFTEEDRRIFGVFPTWLFLLILAGAVALIIIIIVEIFKRRQK